MSSPSASRIRDRLVSEFLGARLIENSLRGYWCEAMVAEALGPECKVVSGGWYPWDLQFGPDDGQFPQRIRIQIKNAARLQTWNAVTGKRSKALFSLRYSQRPYYFGRDAPNVPCEEFGFLCDVFILCYHPVSEPDEADHTNPLQWQFFILPVVGPRDAVTQAERKYLYLAAEKGRASATHRRPETLVNGIRGRPAVPRLTIEELTPERFRACLASPSSENTTSP